MKLSPSVKSKSIQDNTLRRRSFLSMLGKAGISPAIVKSSAILAGVLAQRQAHANTQTRVIYCCLTGGGPKESWLPHSSTEMNQGSKPYGADGYDIAHLCQFRHVEVISAGHSNAKAALGKTSFTPDIDTADVILANSIQTHAPHSHMHLGYNMAGPNLLTPIPGSDHCSSAGPAITSPEQAINFYFTREQNSSTAKVQINHMHTQALKAIKPKLSHEEQQKIEEHMDVLERINQRIDATYSKSCQAPSLDYAQNMQAIGKMHADIIVAALQCGITNTAVLQIGTHMGTWANHMSAQAPDYHLAMNTNRETFREMFAYLCDIPAYFIKRLTQELASDGTRLIDTTLFAQVNDTGDGSDHSTDCAPFLLASADPTLAPLPTTMNTLQFHNHLLKHLNVPEKNRGSLL